MTGGKQLTSPATHLLEDAPRLKSKKNIFGHRPLSLVSWFHVLSKVQNLDIILRKRKDELLPRFG